MKKLAGKVALITGGSAGIGLAIGKALSAKGVRVFDISRTVKENSFYEKAFQCDVNNTDRMSEIIDEIYALTAHIDIFVNNAGFGIAGAVESAKRDSVYSMIDTNLSAVIALSSLAIGYLKKSGGGNIINTCSVGGIIPLPFQATYSASKAGVEVFSRALDNEVRPYDIHVTAILPGDTKTNFTANRIIENNKGDITYQKRVSRSIKKVEKDEQTGKSPDTVAKVVVKVLRKKHPPLRITVGFWYKCATFLPRVLPTKLVNAIVRKIYC